MGFLRGVASLAATAALASLVAAGSFEDGVARLAAGDRDGARPLFEKAAAEQPSDAGAIFYVALLDPDADRAAERFVRVVKLAPQSEYAARARAELASYHLSRGMSLSAAQDVAVGLEALPAVEKDRALLVKVRSQIASGSAADALALLDAERADSRSPWFVLARADALAASGKHAEAVSAYRRVVAASAAHPSATLALLGMAESASRCGDHASLDLALSRLRACDLPSYLRAETDRLARGAAPVDTSAATAKFAIQVGAFGVRENAERMRDQFAGRGYEVRIVSRKGATPLYVVLVGAYATSAEAERAKAKIEAEDGTRYFVKPYE